MPQLPFQPDPGLFTDTSTFSGKGGWIACSNVRFYNGRWEVIGGQAQRVTTGATIAATISAILEWRASDGTVYVAWGSGSSGSGVLTVEKSTVLYTVTPVGVGIGTPGWSFANYGETLIANLSGDKIYQWSLNTAVVAAAVSNAPAVVTCVLVTPSRQLIAFGCNEESSGTFNGRCIRCSDIEDITSWTTTATNNVEENILDGAASAIVTARLVGEYVAVWTSNDLWMGQFIGDPGQTWRYEKVGSLCGAISLRGVCVANGTAYWLTPDLKFMAWSPGEAPTEIPCPIIENLRTSFPTTASLIANTFACHVAKFNEVWFTFSNSGTNIGRYVAFSLSAGHWFKGSMNRRAMHQGVTGLLGAVETNTRVNCESGKQGYGGPLSSGLTWSIQSSDIYIDSGQRRMMIRSFRPDNGAAGQAGNMTVTVYAKDYPNESYRTGTAQTITSSTKKKDFRQSGRLISVLFSGDDVSVTTDTFQRQGLCVFDIVALGER